jgi:hypothetical protein
MESINFFLLCFKPPPVEQRVPFLSLSPSRNEKMSTDELIIDGNGRRDATKGFELDGRFHSSFSSSSNAKVLTQCVLCALGIEFDRVRSLAHQKIKIDTLQSRARAALTSFRLCLTHAQPERENSYYIQHSAGDIHGIQFYAYDKVSETLTGALSLSWIASAVT